MTLGELHELAVQMGIKSDPRTPAGVKSFLGRQKKAFDAMPEKKKKFFDRESLTNPFSDSRILFGDPKTPIKRVMAGIDAEAAEVLLVDRLNQKGQKIDVLISHHPSGHALASLDEVMDVQVDTFADAGVPVNVAHALFAERRSLLRRRLGPLNHTQAVDTARLLEVPFMSIHTIWDNIGDEFMKQYVAKVDAFSVGELLDAICEIPEYIESTRAKSGPSIISGNASSRTGRVVVNFTGGTNPSKDLYIELAKAGVGTLVEMHVPEDAVKELQKMHINIIDCGHMAADSIGANIYLDVLEKKGVEVIPCSGLIRVRRNKS
jgi:putative NIF3 family GTP cyclohydrolase 1 type 2